MRGAADVVSDDQRQAIRERIAQAKRDGEQCAAVHAAAQWIEAYACALEDIQCIVDGKVTARETPTLDALDPAVNLKASARYVLSKHAEKPPQPGG